jgi:hypothetical protein
MSRTFPRNELSSSEGADGACAARVMCAITFHFVAARLEYLADVLQALAEYPVTLLEVHIVANAISEGESSTLRCLAEEILGPDRVSIHRVDDLAHPFDLAWRHKELLARHFLGAGADFTHFIYLEDDIRFTFANFRYFVEERERLRERGLLPAFLRAEWSQAANGLVATDCFWPVYVPVQPHLRAGEIIFANMPNPYNPCFVLDRELAAEYVASPFFDKEASGHLAGWGIRERAAMGLCLENVPKGFRSRYVVPVSTRTNSVVPVARIRHLQGTYATQATTGLGKVRLEALLHGARSIGVGSWWPRLAQPDSASGFLLVSHHDTIVYFDWASGELHHGPFGVVPLNLTVELAGREAVVTGWQDGGGNHRAVFQCERAGDTCIALKRGNRYATADADGVFRVDRAVMNDWEKFGLMRCDTVSGIGVLARHLWKGDADQTIVRLEAQAITFWPLQASPASALAATTGRDAPAVSDGVTFGKVKIRLVTHRSQLEFVYADAPGTADPAKVIIVAEDGTVSSFSRIDGAPHVP